MGIIPASKYTNTKAADADYTYGSAINPSAPGLFDATPLEKDWVNDIWGFLQKLCVAGSVVPSGSPDTVLASDYFDALSAVIALQSADGVWQTPSLLNGWLLATNNNLRYRLANNDKILQIIGSLDAASATNETFMLLPAAYRPAPITSQLTISGAVPLNVADLGQTAVVTIFPSGNVSCSLGDLSGKPTGYVEINISIPIGLPSTW